jgi:hypothetical protein
VQRGFDGSRPTRGALHRLASGRRTTDQVTVRILWARDGLLRPGCRGVASATMCPKPKSIDPTGRLRIPNSAARMATADTSSVWRALFRPDIGYSLTRSKSTPGDPSRGTAARLLALNRRVKCDFCVRGTKAPRRTPDSRDESPLRPCPNSVSARPRGFAPSTTSCCRPCPSSLNLGRPVSGRCSRSELPPQHCSHRVGLGAQTAHHPASGRRRRGDQLAPGILQHV